MVGRASLALLIASAAFAHGAPPRANDVVGQPGAPAVKLVSTTFGALVSRDDGATFRWLCDEVLGTYEGEAPLLHLTTAGTLLVGTFGGALRSTNGGCELTPLSTFAATGVSAFAQSGDGLFATTARFGATNGLFVSRDDGASWSPTSLSSAADSFTAVVFAPSRPARVYVSGWYYQPASDSLWVSDDGAATFSEVVLDAALPANGRFVVLAVHPTQPEVLLAAVTEDASTARTWLLRSADAGASFTPVLQLDAAVTQAAFDADGQGAWAAAGGSVYRSTDGAMTFSALSSPTRDACVRAVDGQIYACGHLGADGYAVAKLDASGAPTPWLAWSKLAGVVDCGGTGVEATCAVPYPVQRTELGLPPEDPTTTEPPKGCGCGTPARLPALFLGAAIFVSVRRRRTFASSP